MIKHEWGRECDLKDHHDLYDEFCLEADETLREVVARLSGAAVQRTRQLQASQAECESYKARAEAAEKDRRAWHDIAQSRLESGLAFDTSQQKLIDELKKLCVELRKVVHNSTELDLNSDPKSHWWTRLAAADHEMIRLGMNIEDQLTEADNDS